MQRPNPFVAAVRGVALLLRDERNARIHAMATAAVVALGIWCNLAPTDWGLLALACSTVLAAEGMNTAVERLVDHSSPEYSDFARDAKDIAAGAVLLSSLGALAVGVAVFLPHLLECMG